MIEITVIKHNNTMLWNNWASVDAPVVSCTDNVVTMTCSTNGATIHYSTDGGSSYSVYSTPITISATTNYTVYATKSGMNDSNIVTYTATFKETVATPVVSCTNNVVTMSCSTSGATIKYSTNGGSSYSTYSSPITISATTTYTVYATKSGMFDSATTTYKATYVKPKLPDPTITFSYVNSMNKATIETPGISGVTYYVKKATGNSAISCSDIDKPNAQGNSDFRGTGTGNNSTYTISVAEFVRHCGIKVLSVKSGYRDSDITCKTYDH